jgi:hypothetical protein
MAGELELDHVLIAVPDLEEGARWLAAAQGLTAVPGGRHPGRGTANMIVPLGSSYLELITVVNPAEADQRPFSLVPEALSRGWRFAGWAVRTAELDDAAARWRGEGVEVMGPFDGARRRPDGAVLRWRTWHEASGGTALPFLIEWDVPPGEHPAERAVQHPAGDPRIELVELVAVDPNRVRAILGDSLPYSVEKADESRVVRIRLSTGEID